MKIDVGKIALVAVMIAGIQTSALYHRINDLECQRDIYKSRYEDWEGVSKEVAEYADTLRDSLKASCLLYTSTVQKSGSTSAAPARESPPAAHRWKLM